MKQKYLLYFFLSLILLLSVLLSGKTKKNNERNNIILYNGDYWNNYRIGDLYRFGKFKNNLYHKYHMTSFPHSIAYYYHLYNPTDIVSNEKAMKKAINKVQHIINYKKVESVLHIRVGDVMSQKNTNRYSKVNNVEWWDNYIKWLKTYNVKNVTIIAGSHNQKLPHKWTKSINYLLDRKVYLENNGLSVGLSIGNSPDEDIITAYNSKYFASTGGGYGFLMKTLSKLNNVNIYNDDDKVF